MSTRNANNVHQVGQGVGNVWKARFKQCKQPKITFTFNIMFCKFTVFLIHLKMVSGESYSEEAGLVSSGYLPLPLASAPWLSLFI